MRGLSASTLFCWLFALAVSTHVIYSETIQLAFFAMLFACGWTVPSLRAGVLANVRHFFTRSEGKVLLLLLLSATITTVLVSWRQSAFSETLSDMSSFLKFSVWHNWLRIIMCGVALFGCTGLLALPSALQRRTLQLVVLCVGCATLLWLSVLVAERIHPGITIPYSKNAYLYWLYSQAGVTVIFFPLLIAAFTHKGASLTVSRKPFVKSFWRWCVFGALLLFLATAIFSERRLVVAALIAGLIVFIFAAGQKSRLRKWLPVLLGVCALCVAGFLIYSYQNPEVHGLKSPACESCNTLFLPTWLVDDTRQFVWRETLVMWEAAPWFGRGIDTAYNFVEFHPHSRFLDLLTALGVVGFIPFLWLLILIFVKSCIAWHRTSSISALSLMCVHSVYWTIGVFDLSLWKLWHFGMYICAIVLSLSLDRLIDAHGKSAAA